MPGGKQTNRPHLALLSKENLIGWQFSKQQKLLAKSVKETEGAGQSGEGAGGGASGGRNDDLCWARGRSGRSCSCTQQHWATTREARVIPTIMLSNGYLDGQAANISCMSLCELHCAINVCKMQPCPGRACGLAGVADLHTSRRAMPCSNRSGVPRIGSRAEGAATVGQRKASQKRWHLRQPWRQRNSFTRKGSEAERKLEPSQGVETHKVCAWAMKEALCKFLRQGNCHILTDTLFSFKAEIGSYRLLGFRPHSSGVTRVMALPGSLQVLGHFVMELDPGFLPLPTAHATTNTGLCSC